MHELISDGVTPLYEQLSAHLRRQIEEGVLVAGGQIPSEKQLVQQYNVSRITVRKSIERLVEEGLLIKRQGKGTYVAFPEFTEDMCGGPNTGSFTDLFTNLNLVPTTKVIQKSLGQPTAVIRKRLGLSENAPMVYISRVRYISGHPAVYEEDFFSQKYKFLLETDLENKSLLGVLFDKMHVQPQFFHDTFQVQLAEELPARLLEVPKGQPLLRVSQSILDQNEQIVYYNEQLVRSDVYKYTVKSAR